MPAPAGLSQTTPERPAPERLHLAYLDGIRALAALYILFYHSWIGQNGLGRHTGLHGWLGNWLLYGHADVCVFLVLSGFCLVLPVSRQRTLKGGPWLFFRRRAHRILPPFYAACLLCLFLHLVSHHLDPHHSTLTLPALLANVLLLQDVVPAYAATLNGTFWSVALEWKIYFLFPLFASLLVRRGAGAVLGLAALIAASLTWGFQALRPGMVLDHTCPWYVFLFALGMYAGETVFGPGPRGPLRNWLCLLGGLALAVMALYAIYPVPSDAYIAHLPLLDTAVGALAAIALLCLGENSRQPRPAWPVRALSWRPLVFVGTFAYSIYLMHLPLLMMLQRLLNSMVQHGLPPVAAQAGLFFVGVPLIVAICYLFFLAFERPFLNAHRRETPAEAARDAVLAPAP